MTYFEAIIFLDPMYLYNSYIQGGYSSWLLKSDVGTSELISKDKNDLRL